MLIQLGFISLSIALIFFGLEYLTKNEKFFIIIDILIYIALGLFLIKFISFFI